MPTSWCGRSSASAERGSSSAATRARWCRLPACSRAVASSARRSRATTAPGIRTPATRATRRPLAAPLDLRRQVVGLLEDLAWEGMFELELIESASDGWHAIDMNPRPYGSLALAIGAGANLPALWCRHLLGDDPDPVAAVPGVFYRWTDADLRHGLWKLRAGNAVAAAGVLRPRRRVVHAFGRRSDPGRGARLARMLELPAADRRRRTRTGREGSCRRGLCRRGLCRRGLCRQGDCRR